MAFVIHANRSESRGLEQVQGVDDIIVHAPAAIRVAERKLLVKQAYSRRPYCASR